MGWAKYYEDNVSIYNGRMAMNNWTADEHPLKACVAERRAIRIVAHQQPVINTKIEVESPKKKNASSRNGIELVFRCKLEARESMKLQLNGWWWSKAKNCWCNADTTVNRRYAAIVASKQDATFSLVMYPVPTFKSVGSEK